jgi:hypothetical protein
VLARGYGVASWLRLVLACRMTDAICRDALETVRTLVTRHPRLLHEDARGVKGNWGPPMSYAANLGRTRMIEFLRGVGAEDVQFAFDRARTGVRDRPFTRAARHAAGRVDAAAHVRGESASTISRSSAGRRCS